MSARKLPDDPAEWTLFERRHMLMLDMEAFSDRCKESGSTDTGDALLLLERAHDLLADEKKAEGECDKCGEPLYGLTKIHHHN